MSAGNRNSPTKAHQFGQHFRPGHNRQSQLPGSHDLGVGTGHRTGDDQHVSSLYVRGIMADMNRGPDFSQVSRRAALNKIGTRHIETLVDQHFRDAAHTGPANTHQVHALNAPHRLQV